MKRYIYIILGIIVFAVVAVGLLFLWQKSRTSGTATTTTTGTTGSLPVTGTQSNGTSGTNGVGTEGVTGTGSTTASSNTGSATNFGVVDAGPVLNYFVDAQNNIFAINTDGSIQEVTNGQVSTLSSSTFTNIISADFSYDGKKVLVLSGSQNDPAADVFTIASDTWTALPNGLVGAKWSPTSYQIAYLAPGSAATAIGTINETNLKAAPVSLGTVNAEDLSLAWPSSSQIVLADKPSANVATSILLFNIKTKAVTPIVIEESGLESLWTNASTSPTSTETFGLVFAQSGGGGYTLQLDGVNGNMLEALNFVTLPSKCSFGTSASSSPLLYCGVPRDQSTFLGAHLPDDYDQLALFTSDDIYEIDLVSGSVTTLWNDATQNMDVSAVKSANNDIFFINRYDQKLYALTLQSASQ